MADHPFVDLLNALDERNVLAVGETDQDWARRMAEQVTHAENLPYLFDYLAERYSYRAILTALDNRMLDRGLPESAPA